MHTARAAAALLAVGRYLYVIGGIAGSTQIAQVERYDPATNTWRNITQMPRPRNHVAGYVNGQLACVAGGREPSTSSAVDCLDTTTTTWRPGIPLPTRLREQPPGSSTECSLSQAESRRVSPRWSPSCKSYAGSRGARKQ